MSGLAGTVENFGIAWVIGCYRFFCVVCHKPERVQPYFEMFWWMACFGASLAIEVNQWPEAVRFAADDRHHEGQTERAGAYKRARCAAHTQPDGQRLLQWSGAGCISRIFS